MLTPQGFLKDSSEFKTFRQKGHGSLFLLAMFLFLVWDVKHELHNFQIF